MLDWRRHCNEGKSTLMRLYGSTCINDMSTHLEELFIKLLPIRAFQMNHIYKLIKYLWYMGINQNAWHLLLQYN